MAEEAATKITLKSSDGETFEIDELVAMESKMLENMIEDNCTNSIIPILNIDAKILSMVIDYCKKHIEVAAIPTGDDKAAEEALKEWDAEFVNMDQATLYDLILSSNFLNLQRLLDLTCQTVADMIKGKTPAVIHTLFNIKNDFTSEEEAEIQKVNQWAFE